MDRLTITPRRNHGYLIAAIVLTLLVGFISLFIHKAHAESTVPASDEHVITLHDDGVDKGFITKAKTLREAFSEAGIRIDANDLTEPGLDDELVAGSYEVNIYRARPVIIRAGDTETKIITAYRTGKQIAEQAGLKLHDEDIATLDRSQDVLTDGAAEVLTIHFATPFTFVFYGKTIEAYTQAKTVGAMLKEKGITPAANDTLTPGEATPLTAGMKVQLWKNGEQTVTVDEDVPFETEQVKDANRDKGYKEVKTPGTNGKKTVTYKVVMQNGKEVSRQMVNSVTTKEAVKQVEVIGAKVQAITGTCGEWMAAAGVPNTDDANYLIARESHCNPNSVNRSSGACGIGQALPCSKMGPVNADGTSAVDPVGHMTWMNNYVLSRYGSWAAAANHHRLMGWY